MANQLIWTDIPVLDLDRACKFYAAVLDGEVRISEGTDGASVGLLPQSRGGVSGCLSLAGGEFQPSAGGALIYLNCEGSLDRAQKAVEAHGGRVLRPTHTMGDSAFRVLILDSEGNRLALCAAARQTLDQMVRRRKHEIRGQANYHVLLLDLARQLADQGHKLEAYEQCRRAMALACEEPEVARMGRRLMGELVPGYHGPMVNDARRNAAWDSALRRAIGPTTRALEIGTGTGMLAMMAARAGAAMVTTCEYHPIVAAVAREVVAKNGLQDRIKVVSKSSLDLQIGADLEEQADLLFCDNFADGLFGFRPLRSIADARQRLLKPGAQVLPAAAASCLALGNWGSYRKFYQMDRSCDFDVTALADLVCVDVDLDIGDPTIGLLSPAEDVFHFNFSASTYPENEQVEIVLRASQDGIVNGIVQWIRLELDNETVLEARPEPGASFFSNPRFYPLRLPLTVKAGDVVKVHGQHDGEKMFVWLDEQ